MAKVSALVREKLTNDMNFRLNTAIALECGERNVQYLTSSNSSKLAKKPAVEYYRSTGLTDDQIFEPETENVTNA